MVGQFLPGAELRDLRGGPLRKSSCAGEDLIANDSPFALPANIAFYHSTSKVLIGVAQVDLPTLDSDPPFVQVEMVWNNPTTLNSALITVVADDDGTGQGIFRESNEADNALSTTLTTCPGP